MGKLTNTCNGKVGDPKLHNWIESNTNKWFSENSRCKKRYLKHFFRIFRYKRYFKWLANNSVIASWNNIPTISIAINKQSSFNQLKLNDKHLANPWFVSG